VRYAACIVAFMTAMGAALAIPRAPVDTKFYRYDLP